MEASSDDTILVTSCPWCNIGIGVARNQINCKIFRCGVYKQNVDMQIKPHAPKEICDSAAQRGQILGCGKPFTFNGDVTERCDYI